MVQPYHVEVTDVLDAAAHEAEREDVRNAALWMVIMAVLGLTAGDAMLLAHFSAASPAADDQLAAGDADRGRDAFIRLQCSGCHRVLRDDKLPKPVCDGPVLRNLDRQKPEAVANMIVSRSELDPESLYSSEMGPFASAITKAELADVVAYLRRPARD